MTIKEGIENAKDQASTWGRPVLLHHLNAWHVLEVMKEEDDFEDEWGHISDDEITDMIHEEWDR